MKKKKRNKDNSIEKKIIVTGEKNVCLFALEKSRKQRYELQV